MKSPLEETHKSDTLSRLLMEGSISYADVEKMKVIIVGDCQVGKTHLLHTYVYEMWDTSGEERYRALASVWYRHAMGALVVFDLTDADSFKSVPNWIEVLLSSCHKFVRENFESIINLHAENRGSFNINHSIFIS